MTIDTLKFAKRLEGRGVFAREQAESFTEELKEALSEDYVTRADLKDVENTIIKWMIGVAIAAVVVALTIAKAIF